MKTKIKVTKDLIEAFILAMALLAAMAFEAISDPPKEEPLHTQQEIKTGTHQAFHQNEDKIREAK
ncbi:hypothetical protein AAG747_16555 [Rapidithrix thailandica]|uniref:Uncharacterized protein n=1 Tax=Rapidithrix thailandica TaxID=413964 RepID=A0AAW9SFB1_9BACT